MPMGRHWERHPRRSAATLWPDIVVLADAGEEGDRTETPEGFCLGLTIEAAGEGGRVLRIRSVRTWLAS